MSERQEKRTSHDKPADDAKLEDKELSEINGGVWSGVEGSTGPTGEAPIGKVLIDSEERRKRGQKEWESLGGFKDNSSDV